METHLESHQCQGFSVGKQVLKNGLVLEMEFSQLPKHIQHHASVGNYVGLPVNISNEKPRAGTVQENSLYSFPVNQSKDLGK